LCGNSIDIVLNHDRLGLDHGRDGHAWRRRKARINLRGNPIHHIEWEDPSHSRHSSNGEWKECHSLCDGVGGSGGDAAAYALLVKTVGVADAGEDPSDG